MSADRSERKLRELVETSGFILAVSLDQTGVFRILDTEANIIASASTSSTGFRVFFPKQRRQVSSASDLADALERLKAES